jgi:hypothetical protein
METHFVDPFTTQSMQKMISITLSAADRYSAHGVEFVVGLTGGTNIMAVALGIVAMIRGYRCNYVLNKEEDFLLKIDTFREIDRSVPLREIDKFFLEA